MAAPPDAPAADRRPSVLLVAFPEATISSLGGIYEALTCFEEVGTHDADVTDPAPFDVEIVAAEDAPLVTFSGFPVRPDRRIADVGRTDVVIVPGMAVEKGDWVPGRHPELVAWLVKMHEAGAVLCSACSGGMLLAETGLLDGREATVHWAYEASFRERFPDVELRTEEALVVSGKDEEFVMSGAAASWQDLVLYLMGRYAGPVATRAVARFLLLQSHPEGQAPYVAFQAPRDHGDAAVLGVQEWLDDHYDRSGPVEAMVERSGLPARTFKRRFKAATGHTPISYVQHLRVRRAKHLLETTDRSIDRVAWRVGYRDPSFFRRLFKRLAGTSPGVYRRRFRLPEPAGGGGR